MRAAFFSVALLWAGAALADELPYPAGRSVQQIEGTETALLIPDDLSAEKPGSFVILLHGAGDNGPNLIGALHEWMRERYVVCAPSATGGTWDTSDLAKTKRIALHLMKVLPVDRERVHAIGFSNGGWNLAPIAFDDDLKPCSACWIAAGYNGGKVGRWAKKGLGALALAGANDPNAGAARQTVPLLKDKVRSVEVRLQEGLGHKWPRDHDKYHLWWAGAMEGRFNPDTDMNFAWGDDLDAAIEALKSEKRGGIFIYFHAPEDKEKPEAHRLQNSVFMDLAVRHFGNQLKAVKLDLGDESAKYGVKVTPAVAVLKKDGTLKKLLSGKIKAKSLASALRSVAPKKKPPKR
jgi:predicted esterase